MWACIFLSCQTPDKKRLKRKVAVLPVYSSPDPSNRSQLSSTSCWKLCPNTKTDRSLLKSLHFQPSVCSKQTPSYKHPHSSSFVCPWLLSPFAPSQSALFSGQRVAVSREMNVTTGEIPLLSSHKVLNQQGRLTLTVSEKRAGGWAWVCVSKRVSEWASGRPGGSEGGGSEQLSLYHHSPFSLWPQKQTPCSV